MRHSASMSYNGAQGANEGEADVEGVINISTCRIALR